MATAYEGTEPYIFVSYSHKDKTQVMRYINALEQHGFLVWFDGGIEAGSEWPDYIAEHLANSMCVMAFISSNFVESRNCRQELAFSQELEKQQLNVYIEKIDQMELPMGIRMQLGLYQSIKRENFDSEETFIKHLCNAKLICDCQKSTSSIKKRNELTYESNSISKDNSTQIFDANIKQVESIIETTAPSSDVESIKNKQKLDKKAKKYGRICSLIEFSYIPISAFVINFVFEKALSIPLMIIIMAIPHIVLVLLYKLVFFKPLSKKYKRAGGDNSQLKDASLSVVICFVLSSIIAIIVSAFKLNIDMNIFLRLLISLGLNVIPFVFAGFLALFLEDA